MPRIPLAARPQLGGHQDSTAPLSGAPSLNWRADNGLQQIGDAIAKGTGAIGDTVQNIAVSSLRLEVALQETEDKNQFNELELFETSRNAEAERYFRENPGEYSKFPEYLRTMEKDASDIRRKFLDKMSPSARQQAEFAISQNTLARENFMEKIRYQAHVTSLMQDMENQLTSCAKLGAWDKAEQIIAGHEKSNGEFPPLLTREMAEKYRAHYRNLSEWFTLRDQIESGSLVRMPKNWNKNAD